MSYDFRFLGPEGREIARGQMTSVCCVLEPGKPLRAIPIPESVAARIEQAENG
jgi:hypothetical protein